MDRTTTIIVMVALVLAAVPAGVASAEDGGDCGSQDDAGTGEDADPDDPVALPTGEVSGCVSQADERDAYSVSLDRGDQLTVEILEPDCEEESSIRVSLGVFGPREAECDRTGDASFTYTADDSEDRTVNVFHEDHGTVNYTLEVTIEQVPLPDPAVAGIDDGTIAELETPVGTVPFGNLLIDTEPFEVQRERDVAVTVTNEGDGSTTRPVDVDLYAVPEDCALPGSVSPPNIERARCGAERILGGQAQDLHPGQEVTFEGTWDTTKTVGDQRLHATIGLHGGPDTDTSNNELTATTPVLVGTDKGVN